MGLGGVLHLNHPWALKTKVLDFQTSSETLRTESRIAPSDYVKMTRRTAKPNQVSKAIAMREAGYTVLSISQELGMSVRTLNRHFAEHGAKKGTVKDVLLEEARNDLMKRVLSDDAIREEAARLINDDLAHARHLRTLLADAAEQLVATSLKDAVLVMRAAAAYSTAIKNTSDTLRQSLRIDKDIDDAGKNLPELIIRELSGEEVSRIKENQASEVYESSFVAELT